MGRQELDSVPGRHTEDNHTCTFLACPACTSSIALSRISVTYVEAECQCAMSTAEWPSRVAYSLGGEDLFDQYFLYTCQDVCVQGPALQAPAKTTEMFHQSLEAAWLNCGTAASAILQTGLDLSCFIVSRIEYNRAFSDIQGCKGGHTMSLRRSVCELWTSQVTAQQSTRRLRT